MEEAQKDHEEGNKKEAARLFTEAQKQQQVVREQKEIMEALEKKLREKEKASKEMIQNMDKAWYQDLNFSSWQMWLIISLFLFFSYVIYRVITYAWGKIKGMFSGDN